MEQPNGTAAGRAALHFSGQGVRFVGHGQKVAGQSDVAANDCGRPIHQPVQARFAVCHVHDVGHATSQCGACVLHVVACS